MKEYKLKVIQVHGQDQYLLEPLVPGDKPHYILFESREEAHQGKLSLGLGTTADPIKSPQQYRVLNNRVDDLPLYKFIEGSMAPDQNHEYDEGCCYSGCAGCPTYAKKMGW